MFNWLGISAVNPLLLIGALGIAAPIIIHLLAKRRFRVVAWAAMQFLLEAEQKNRKRVKLEQLLLLLLRCLAILLIAFLLSRLFIQPQGLAALISPSASTERIILFDDSPSMQQRVGPRTLFDSAKQSLISFIRQTARTHPGDSITLVLTSSPDRPLLNGQYLHQSESIVRTIDTLKCSDVPATMDQALAALVGYLDEQKSAGTAQVNRTLYAVTDLRRRDWSPSPSTPADRSVAKLLERLDERLQGVLIVDLEPDQAGNLAITSVGTTDKAIVANVPAQLRVAVTNFGLSAAQNVPVTLQVGDSAPLNAVIPLIAPGATASTQFAYSFADTGSVPVTATIEPDMLPADDHRFFAAQVTTGVKVLLVDGDPSAEYGRSETFFLHRALAPPGSTASGNLADTATDSQFAALDLSPYQVIWLTNLYQMPDAQRDALEQWVNAGGGLVIAPGDQIDPTLYNQLLWRDGKGLLPMPIGQVAGDPNQRTYVNMTIVTPNHPVMGAFEGTNNPAIGLVKFYRWWAPLTEPAADAANPAHTADTTTAAMGTVIAALTDADHSPLLLEKSFGSGRVAMLTSAVDGDWSNWPNDPTYVVTMLELNRRVARPMADRGDFAVGSPLVWPLDLAHYRPDATITNPDSNQPTTLQAVAQTAKPGNTTAKPAAGEGDNLAFVYTQTQRAGFYRLTLSAHDGSQMPLLFAANIDPTEGDLARMDHQSLAGQLENTHVKIVTAAEYLDQSDTGGKSELWRPLAMLLLIVLAAEQSLAWWFGRQH